MRPCWSTRRAWRRSATGSRSCWRRRSAAGTSRSAASSGPAATAGPRSRSARSRCTGERAGEQPEQVSSRAAQQRGPVCTACSPDRLTGAGGSAHHLRRWCRDRASTSRRGGRGERRPRLPGPRRAGRPGRPAARPGGRGDGRWRRRPASRRPPADRPRRRRRPDSASRGSSPRRRPTRVLAASASWPAPASPRIGPRRLLRLWICCAPPWTACHPTTRRRWSGRSPASLGRSCRTWCRPVARPACPSRRTWSATAAGCSWRWPTACSKVPPLPLGEGLGVRARAGLGVGGRSA